jgi:limonene-1,2-epoxide hydrolase
MTKTGPIATILSAAALAAVAATGASAQSSGDVSLADREAANEQLVRNFFSEASTDLDHIRDFLAEDVTFRYEDILLEGLDAYIAQAAPKMAAVSSYAIEPLRFAVIGDTVMNERVDIATLADGREIRLNVASVFLIADGKIAEWREYPLPDATP